MTKNDTPKLINMKSSILFIPIEQYARMDLEFMQGRVWTVLRIAQQQALTLLSYLKT